MSADADPPTPHTDATSSAGGAADAGLAAGARPLPDYQLVRRRGRGGFGEVWEALGPGGRPVALKFVALGGRSAASEMRALELLRHVRHPHLIAVFGVWQRDGRLIVAMELGDATLADRAQAGPFTPGELLGYLRDAARGLDYLNEPRHAGPDGTPVGIQHKDVKPANLLLVGGGVKVADFGLARLVEQTAGQVSAVCTPGYAAPELLGGTATRWTDQYALAVTWCQLRGGRLPFEGPPAAVLSGHLHGRPDLAMLPEAERPAVARALSKRPEQRWPSCAAFVEALAAAVAAAPEAGATATLRPAPRSRRRRVWAALLLAALAAPAVWWLTRPDHRPAADEPGKPGPRDGPAPADKPPLPDRAKALALLRKHGATVVFADDERGWPVRAVVFKRPGPAAEALKALAHLPETRLVSLSGPAVTDESLPHLAGLKGLEQLDLFDTQIRGPGLAALAGHDALHSLQIGSAPLTDAGLRHLPPLPTLKTLTVTDAPVGDEGLGAVAHAPLLHTLDLSGTRVEGRLLALLPDGRLTALTLTGCPVTDEALAHLRRQPRLSLLLLSRTRVTGAGMAHLQGLRGLRSLALDSTGIDDAGLACLAGLTQLRSLYLSTTGVSDVGLGHLRALAELEELGLMGTRVTAAKPRNFAGLKKLRVLYLASTQVGDDGLAHLATLPALTDLHLNGAPVTDDGLTHLRDYPALEVLHLHNNFITDAGLLRLAAAARLQTVTARGQNVTPAGRAALREKRPGLKVSE